ncbi:MAG TPA: YggS family pyridoxal phosphate-dependent enzyme [Alphaproteobacteria bacterium]|mgnify:CR=1 FL=1|nr:YggS family pyridoxal phosphate-dependent enzyme [Alphaproteobacteria bacterium]
MCGIINIDSIEKRIGNACSLAGHLPSDVVLVAVTKTLSSEMIDKALDADLRIFGENRVQEAMLHWSTRRAAYSDLELHLIGSLQTNKVRDAVSLFDVIETVDRPALINALVKECEKQNKFPRFFVQVNIGEEPQKAGVLVEDLPEFLSYAKDRGLKIEGLMCIPPADQDPRPFFVQMRSLQQRYQLPYLSMGMSSDFEEAIACGATHIRVGSALFGARP